jgi:hypothetical protein
VKVASTQAAAFTIAMLLACGVAAQDVVGSLAFDRDELAFDRDEPRDLSAVERAAEITLATGYAQGFGQVSSGQPNLTDIGIAGWSLQLGVGYRLLPQLALAVFGGGAVYEGTNLDPPSLYSGAAGLKLDWHLLPAAHELDPWLSFGTGWRGYWIEQSGDERSLQGLDFAKFQAGLDYRVERRAAIGPIVGLDLSRFLWESSSGAGFESTAQPKVNTFVFVGLMGRLDIPKDTQRGTRIASM